ncbi:unnamed protein product [Brassica napus]|nr:unnamed protein product [Brassica napus]
MASNNHFTNSRSNLSTNSDAAEAARNHQQPPGVTFARRTSSGRYVNYSRDDLDSELGSVDFTNYTVHPPDSRQPAHGPVHLPKGRGAVRVKLLVHGRFQQRHARSSHGQSDRLRDESSADGGALKGPLALSLVVM